MNGPVPLGKRENRRVRDNDEAHKKKKAEHYQVYLVL